MKALAEVPEERLLKLWEGLGYYNRARNLKAAACQIMEEYGGHFPETYEEIRSLKGIGGLHGRGYQFFCVSYPKAGGGWNVLRIAARITADEEDIAKASVKARIESEIEEIIPRQAPGDFNQSLIELGAVVCLPNGAPKCGECPVNTICLAHAKGRETDFPVKSKPKKRKKEKRTVFIFRDEEKVAIRKRPSKGLLAGMYEFPNREGYMRMEDVSAYGTALGLAPVRIRKLGSAKHIFSHVEWHMIGYEILVDELEREMGKREDVISGGEGIIFASVRQLQEQYPMPAAFEAYMPR